MLTQQAPFVGRHVTVALTITEIARRGGRAHDRRGSAWRRIGERCALRRQVATMRLMRGRALALRPLRLCFGCNGQTGDSAGDGDRGDPRTQARQRASHRHLVPFVMRQPATSNYVCRCPIDVERERKMLWDEVSTEQPLSVKQFKWTPFTRRINTGKFCNCL